MAKREKVLYEGDTKFEHYQVVDLIYVGREARVLFSGHKLVAQSGLAKDGNPDLLFDYNQRFLELVSSVRPKRILLLGGGAYTLPIALLNDFPAIKIDVVEPDAGLESIAKRFFGLKKDKRLQIFHQNGRKYLENNKKIYDLILIDAFVQNKIPKEISTQQAIKLLHKNLGPNGTVAMNIISPYYGTSSDILKRHYATFCSVFNSVEIYPADKIISLWIAQNFLIIARGGKKISGYKLRFSAMEPLQVNSDEILLD